MLVYPAGKVNARALFYYFMLSFSPLILLVSVAYLNSFFHIILFKVLYYIIFYYIFYLQIVIIQNIFGVSRGRALRYYILPAVFIYFPLIMLVVWFFFSLSQNIQQILSMFEQSISNLFGVPPKGCIDSIKCRICIFFKLIIIFNNTKFLLIISLKN